MGKSLEDRGAFMKYHEEGDGGQVSLKTKEHECLCSAFSGTPKIYFSFPFFITRSLNGSSLF